MMSAGRRFATLTLAALWMLPAAAAQTAPASGSREAMWPAPTAEDWARPCLITWQRTYEDAVALSRATGKALLVCINMDGEIASEHYAGIRYRQPEIAALYEPYITVIASTYRHTPRDHDERGRRILCPRFGSVTCGEHIAIEPGLFDQFMESERVAPRHIGVELDSSELYDVYYAFDTDSVFAAIREGVVGRPPPRPIDRSDWTLNELVASPDVLDRTRAEELYAAGDRAQRLALLESALSAGDAASVDLLRLGHKDRDVELRRMARQALAATNSEGAIELLNEVLNGPLGDEERAALIAALDRLAAGSTKAATLAVVHRGLAGRSDAVDAEGWVAAIERPSGRVPRVDHGVHEARVRDLDEVLASDDALAHVDLAESFLDFAYRNWEADEEYARLLFMDARGAAERAEALGAYGWRVDAAISIAAHYLGDAPEARRRAEAAVSRGQPPDPEGWHAMAVLALFAQSRQEAIRAAFREGREWPAQWLTDVHSSLSVLARHPHGTDEQVVVHHDFLRAFGATGLASRVLAEGIGRFPESWELHDRVRRQILRDHGVEALESTYAAMLALPDASPRMTWYAGYASRIAAEFHRRTGKNGAALAAYERAIAHFEQDIADRASPPGDSDQQIALALAGRARIAFESDDDAIAVEQLLASLARRPQAAATLDGLNISAVDTARMLLARLLDREQHELAEPLQAALGALDPALLELPAYERRPGTGGPGSGRGPRGPQGR